MTQELHRTSSPRNRGDGTSRRGQGSGVAFLRKYANYAGDDCVVFPFHQNPINGYCQFGYLGHLHYAHRFMCELAHGPAPTKKHQAAHSCHTRQCVNPRHVSWKTLGENMLDKRSNGTAGRTNSHGPKGCLTPEQVAEIRAKQGVETQASLAARFNVTEATIRNIYRGKTYTGKITDWSAAAYRAVETKRRRSSLRRSL